MYVFIRDGLLMSWRNTLMGDCIGITLAPQSIFVEVVVDLENSAPWRSDGKGSGALRQLKYPGTFCAEAESV
jgi:hypothetical protein